MSLVNCEYSMSSGLPVASAFISAAMRAKSLEMSSTLRASTLACFTWAMNSAFRVTVCHMYTSKVPSVT